MFSDDDFDDVVIRAAANVDDTRTTTDHRDPEHRDSSAEFEDERGLELALKLSAESYNAVADPNPHSSRVNHQSSSTSNVVEFNEDDDFEFAVRLSKELNNQDSPSSLENSSNSSASNIVTRDEDADFELALKLSEEEQNLRKNNVPSTGCGNFSSVSKVVSFDEDKDFELAVKLSMEWNNSGINGPPSTPSTSSIVSFEDDRDFELALKRSLESSGPSINSASSSHSTHSVVPFDYDQDFELALKLSTELTSESSPKGVSSVTRKEGLPSGGIRARKIPVYDVDNDIIVEKVVHDIIASQKIKITGHSSIVSSSNSRMLAGSNESVRKYLNKDVSLVDPCWETIDPNPDIHAMFVAFNQRFFWGKLDMVEVKWSPRMTLCAGNCTYKRVAGHCIVNLSKPLLQLRPRKDLVETLLHEMIHAYLFVTHNDRDRDGHGPRFHSHMYRINKESGTKISVYHNFHDEVKYYKQHEWRCTGPCRDRPPFYGFVRRSMNRVPGPSDNWWDDHAARCHGQFVKTKEPEGYANRKAASDSRNALGVENKGSTYDIENYFKIKASKNTTIGSSDKPAFNLSSSAPPAMPVPVSKTAATNVPARIPSKGPRIFTLNDLSNDKKSASSSPSQSSPKSWVPLQGQGNIRHFVNNS